MGIVRSFIAIPVRGLSSVESLARDLGRIRGVKGVRTENIHITLKFLGNIEEESDLPIICDGLREVSENHQPFSINFKGTGAFPNIPRMRVAWIGLESDKLEFLASNVQSKVHEILPTSDDGRQQRFKSHLTIGRIKFNDAIRESGRLLERFTDHEFGELPVDGFNLMKSVLTPQGPIYSVIERFSFEALE